LEVNDLDARRKWDEWVSGRRAFADLNIDIGSVGGNDRRRCRFDILREGRVDLRRRETKCENYDG